MSPDRVAEELDRGINNGEIVGSFTLPSNTVSSSQGIDYNHHLFLSPTDDWWMDPVGRKFMVKNCEGNGRGQKLYQFLMGLNESFQQARSQILMLNPLPTINHAYAMIVGDKSQKAVMSHNTAWELTQLMLTLWLWYPPDFKSKRKPQGTASVGNLDQVHFFYGMNTNMQVLGWGTKTDSSQSDHGVLGPSNSSKLMSQAELDVKQLLKGCTFTKDQYDHILKGFQHKTDIPSLDCNATPAAAHIADIFIRGTVSKLEVPKVVYLPNGDNTQVTHVGSCALGDNGIISNVLYLPDFQQFDVCQQINKGARLLSYFLP
ncbi:hypothetical protein KY284_027275 [Solanum tuberosum]|nr:hypothetical protein KY284_027275 [Solanum tuberosum]